MRPGKLPPELLGRLLRGIPRTDPRVLLSSGIGEDAAVVDFMAPPGGPPAGAAGVAGAAGATGGTGDRLLIAKTDPISFATDQAGWYAVHVNANDVACTGAAPRWFLASALLPPHWEEPDIEALFGQITDACQSIGATLIGGHTEITAGLDRALIAGCMLGEVERARAVRTGGGQVGDALLLTQGLAIEGTSILARDAAERLHQHGVDDAVIASAQHLLQQPGISVVRAAQTLCRAVPAPAGVHSLHDPTEGGLASGLWEVAEASGTGALVDEAAVEVRPETRAICAALGLDPWGLLASGALLAAVAPGATADALEALYAEGIPARVIGHLTARETGLRLRSASRAERTWPIFDRDELARYFDEADS